MHIRLVNSIWWQELDDMDGRLFLRSKHDEVGQTPFVEHLPNPTARRAVCKEKPRIELIRPRKS